MNVRRGRKENITKLGAYFASPSIHEREGRERKIPNVIIVGWPDLHFPLQTRAHKRFVETTRGGEKKCKISSAMKKNESHFHKGIKIFRFLICFERENDDKKNE